MNIKALLTRSLRDFVLRCQSTRLSLFLFAALVGALTGYVGSLFQLGVTYISQQRFDYSTLFQSNYFNYTLAFLIAAVMGAFAFFTVKKIAPEAGGSGIPEIEGALINLRPVRWPRVLFTKFFGGFGALGSGMVLGHEGPTVQMGANLGQMVFKMFRMTRDDDRHILLSVGAGAGITTAFNAPLGGMLFVIEEMQSEFKYNLRSIHSVFIGCITACIVYRFMISPAPVLDLGSFVDVPLESLWLFIILGAIFGILGVISNNAILYLRKHLTLFYEKVAFSFILVGALLGGVFGLFTFILPEISGDGFELIPHVIDGVYALWPLALICLGRLITTILCFSSGAPGGIFSPTLALGTVFGVFLGLCCRSIFPDYDISLSTFAIIGMCGLFASTIRAPLTGMLIVVEMTNSYLLIFPIIITSTIATLVAHLLGGRPLYNAILDMTLQRLGLVRPKQKN